MDDLEIHVSLLDVNLPRAREAELVREALDDVAAGRTVSMEAMLTWVRSIGTQGELPEPEPD